MKDNTQEVIFLGGGDLIGQTLILGLPLVEKFMGYVLHTGGTNNVEHYVLDCMTNKDTLTASEAVFGFAGWITSRDEEVIASAKHDAGVWAELVAEFCVENELYDPRDGWEDNLVIPNETNTQKSLGNTCVEKKFIDPSDLIKEQDTDAMNWANAFIGRIEQGYFTKNDIDESLMASWFASAIENAKDSL